jgi:hypothetical protein
MEPWTENRQIRSSKILIRSLFEREYAIEQAANIFLSKEIFQEEYANFLNL